MVPLAGSRFSEEDFFCIQKMEDQQWRACLALAFFLHAALAGAILFMSPLFEAKLPVEEAVIVSVAPPSADIMPKVGEMSAAPRPSTREKSGLDKAKSQKEARPEKSAEAPSPVRPKPEPEAAPPPPKPMDRPEPAPAKPAPAPKPSPRTEPETKAAEKAPVSLAPQRKQQLAKDTRLQEERDRETRLEDEKKLAKEIELRQKKLEQRQRQREEEQKIREEAARRLAEKVAERKREADRRMQEEARRQAAENARRAEADAQQAEADAKRAREELASMQDAVRRNTGALQGAPQAATGRQEGMPAIEAQYWAQVAARLRSYWKLPEGRNWDASLLAKVSITINSDGQVSRIAFDGRSNDPLFDQLVERTIRQAEPMPRFPAAMRQGSVHNGFRFRPAGVGN